jgi:5'-3' exoribonuclease 1
VKEISAWLKSQEMSKFERVPLEAEQLDSEVVMSLASIGEQVHQASLDIGIRKMRGVPRSAMLKPSDAEMVLGNQNFSLGDRVVFVAAAGKVPIATRGTVVGISRTATALLLDVVWDTSFMSGTTLNDRAPMFRGQTVASSSVLNTTDRQVVSASSKSQNRRTARAPATGAHGSVTTMPQYKDATAPPALRGGWRGAVNGAQSPGRGRGHNGGNQRGAPNLQHSTLVYRDGPPNGGENGVNGNSRGGAQRGGRGGNRGPAAPEAVEAMYSSVPPPANLDTSRGRGRGRGNGRGNGRGRGRGGNRGRGGAGNGEGAGSSAPA